MKSKYQDSIVGIVDILGVSANISAPDKTRRYSEAIAAVLGPMIGDKGEYCFVLPHVEDGRKIEVLLAPSPSRISFISDSIVVSAPLGKATDRRKTASAILACLEAVKGLQRSLLLLGLRSRGGLSKGGLIHSGELLVGEGLLRAYDIERRQSVVPRAVIDPLLIDELISLAEEHFPIYKNRVAHSVRQDEDGAYFVDYLAFCPTNGFCGLEVEFDEISKGIEADLQAHPDAPWAPKLEWLKSYVAASAADCRSKVVAPFEHSRREFSLVYSRTNETLREYMESEAELARRLGHKTVGSTRLGQGFPLWPLGWRTVMTDRVIQLLETELARELAPEHPLTGRTATVLGRYERSDDTLFLLDGGNVAQVHLTWAIESRSIWPWTTIYSSFEDWAVEWRAKMPKIQ